MTSSYLKKSLANRRALELHSRPTDKAILYWMNRDQRVNDNHALSFAQALALEYRQPLIVFYGFDNALVRHNERQLAFCIEGLKQIEKKLRQLRIPFVVKRGSVVAELRKTIDAYDIGTIVTDFSPLRHDRQLLAEAEQINNVGFYLVDAHNIVPCRVVSPKREYAAYTIRPKINKLLSDYVDPAPAIVKHPFKSDTAIEPIDWSEIAERLKLGSIALLFESGEDTAVDILDRFINDKLTTYAERRNDPNADNQSNLSPYLHFGQISPRTVLERTQQVIEPGDALDQFVDELVIRRELSDNFCYYSPDYDKTSAFPDWAQKSLREHTHDPREYLYSLEQFEQCETHDDLWNAAQRELVVTGKMHGYLRMYWAKKILEWTPTAELALQIAIYLNDKYSLDGNDPNGYAGIAWSIGGVHDRPWFERDIFGKVRYMSYSGCKRKFDIDQYIKRTHSTPTNTKPPETIAEK